MQGQKENEIERQPMMTVAEVSDCLALSMRSVYRLVGDLRAVRAGGRWRFRVTDVEQWLLKQRTANEQIEPVEQVGSQVRLYPYLDEENVFLDVRDPNAATLIRNVIDRAKLELTEGPERSAKERIYSSVMERESLCSTALHPEAAFPHPREPERCALGHDQIVVARAAQPWSFGRLTVIGRESSLCSWRGRFRCSSFGKRGSATCYSVKRSSRGFSRPPRPASFARSSAARTKVREMPVAAPESERCETAQEVRA